MPDGGLFFGSAQAAGFSAEPFAVNGLFGWFHSEPKQASRDVAVLICGALSREALDSHHSLRVLADAFAQAGYPTLRFDYAGSGDSADPAQTELPAEFWSIWQNNIFAAADRLRRATGARRLILCGLRIGATLAALAAESRNDIAGLILLAPVLRGRSYLRQLQMEGDFAHGKTAAKTVGLEFQELSLSRETVDLISGVDLRRVKLGHGLKVAVFSQTATLALADCVSAWAEQGAEIDSYAFDGLEPLCCPDTQGYKEPATAAAIIEWLNRVTPSQPLLSNLGLQCTRQGLRLPGCIEQPVRFGPDQRLFGILSRPDARLSEIAVIIVNTGRNPRAGLGRFGVQFARRLAAGGITTLRFDFAGLGDSIGAAGQENRRSDVFEDDRGSDISAAIDMLEQLGCRRFVVHGICSGAYHGLHAAAADIRIEAVLMVNLPLFLWKTGDSIEASKKRSYAFSHYKARLTEPAHWLRLLRGESDVFGIIKSRLPRLAAFIRWPGKHKADGQAQDPVAFARNLLAGLSRRRARTLFLFDPDHAGAYEIQKLFGKGGAGLKAYAGAEIKMVAGLGEAVGESAARSLAADIMIGFIGAL